MYSLHDLFTDINNGNRNDFTYNGQNFIANKRFPKWTIKHVETGNTATCNFYIGCGTDLQGVAACLLAENKSIDFDKQGNIIRN